jgi:hypothetical protein
MPYEYGINAAPPGFRTPEGAELGPTYDSFVNAHAGRPDKQTEESSW